MKKWCLFYKKCSSNFLSVGVFYQQDFLSVNSLSGIDFSGAAYVSANKVAEFP